jgi:hypothetical protein
MTRNAIVAALVLALSLGCATRSPARRQRSLADADERLAAQRRVPLRLRAGAAAQAAEKARPRQAGPRHRARRRHQDQEAALGRPLSHLPPQAGPSRVYM